MTTVLILHSALGLRPAVLATAARLRAAGHEVSTPDLFCGALAADVREAIALRDAIGADELTRRAESAADALGRPFAVVGFSLGAGLAQHLAERRDDVLAAVLFHNARPVEHGERLRPLPLDVHVAVGDPWVDPQAARSLAAASDLGRLFAYPGDGHLFTDPDLPDHDAENSALAEQRLHGALDALRVAPDVAGQPPRRGCAGSARSITNCACSRGSESA